MALLSYGNKQGAVDHPAVVSTWDNVLEAATILSTHCAKEMGSGGVYVMLSKSFFLSSPNAIQYAMLPDIMGCPKLYE